MNNITITRVVSKNFFKDTIENIKNLFGKNLTGYERMINKAIEQITEELNEKEINLSWYRYEVTQLTNGAIAVVLYGDTK